MKRLWILITFVTAIIADAAVRALLSTPSISRTPFIDFAAASGFACCIVVFVWFEMYTRLERVKAERDQAESEAERARSLSMTDHNEHSVAMARIQRQHTVENALLDKQLHEAMGMCAAAQAKYNHELEQNSRAHALVAELIAYVAKLETDLYAHPQLHYQWPKPLREAWEAVNRTKGEAT